MSEEEVTAPTQEEIDKFENRTFERLRKELRPALDQVLANKDGMARLLAISDEEWQAAIDAEAQGGP